MIDRKVAIPLALCVLILVGAALAYVPGVYKHDLSFSLEGDEIHYEYQSNTGSPTKTVMFTITGQYDIDRVVLFLDSGYASTTGDYYQNELAGDMGVQLALRSVDGFQCATASELVAIMAEAEPSHTAVMFASGALPDAVYDGTPDCPLIRWLDRGGTVVNMSGCLGKYISHGPEETDIEECTSYGMLFAGVDDSSFLDSGKRLFAKNQCNETIRDSLDFYINEYTFGIDISSMEDALNLGYVSDDGISAATIFRSGNGMVMNFGASLVNHVHSDHFIAQIIASGIDYSSELIEIQEGHTRGDNAGSMAVPESSCTVYGCIGALRTVYADRFILS